jgi:hypothetical protein
MTTPRIKTQVAIINPLFLDSASAIKPLSNVPTQAPNSRIEVSYPFFD